MIKAFKCCKCEAEAGYRYKQQYFCDKCYEDKLRHIAREHTLWWQRNNIPPRGDRWNQDLA
jgi:hypothetical protein